ncbi:MAG: [Fe-Fe] hydrogenase large subunit C-terminal domain-containing protein, partial [Acinetobacter sp.]
MERIGSGTPHKYPMFTSCCPGWVRFLKSQYPDMVDDLSTAKSPQQMQGAMIKSYFAEKIGVDASNIFSVSVMPCLAKKSECDIPSINDGGGGKDVDLVLTTRELVRQIRSLNIDVAALEETYFDSPLGSGTGAAVIFGATGGVMEAALRSCYFLATGENPDPDAFYKV